MALTNNFKGDFLGFTFNNIHSSTYNIVITSGGNRFEKNLLPQSKDNTVDIPGSDGVYFFDSHYETLSFDIKIAYDNLQEQNIRELQKWLGDRELHDLIFDENPYKVYKVKITGQPKLNFICFDTEDKTARIYKGEGTLQFQAYSPFARARYKTLSEYIDIGFPEKYEWSATSGLLPSLTTPKVYDQFISNICNLYNPGDLKTYLNIPEFAVQSASGYQLFTYMIDGVQTNRLILDMSKLTAGQHYRIDSEKQLILGYDYIGGKWVLNNKVYNGAIAAGDFFRIEPKPVETSQVLTMSPGAGTNINIVRTNGFDIEYNYLYY